MHTWLTAGLWGWLAGSALLIGAAIGWFFTLPLRLTASVMAFGSGVLISALSFDLMDEAQRRGGLLWTGLGFVVGAGMFTGLNWLVSRRGGKHRKSARHMQPSEQDQEGSGMAIALGALLDGIPESIVIGTTLLTGGSVSTVAVVAIFISNLPEGLSSVTGMRHAGRSFAYVASLWLFIAFVSGLASVVGYTAFRHVGAGTTALVTAIAAGAILAMLVDTMIPEAFHETHTLAGLITVAGFLCAFALSRLDEDQCLQGADCGGCHESETTHHSPGARGNRAGQPAGVHGTSERDWRQRGASGPGRGHPLSAERGRPTSHG